MKSNDKKSEMDKKKNIMYLLMYYYKNCNNIYTPKLEVIRNFSSKNHQQQLKLEKYNLYLRFSETESHFEDQAGDGPPA